MTVYVQGESALAYYRNSGTAGDVEYAPIAARSLDGATSSLDEIMQSGIWRLGIGEPSKNHPLEVLVSHARQRSGSKAIHPRIWKGTIAPTAFRQINEKIYVSSPEFVFLQLAQKLTLPQLVALGLELCGTYRRRVEVASLGTTEMSYTTIYQQQPLSTPRRLKGFLASMKSSPGFNRAVKALEYVLPNSASPMESTIYLLLCLPRRLGGYALPKPVLNPPIVFTKTGLQHTLRNSAKPDLYWKAARIDLEYNSDEFHAENQRFIDSMRRKALERMGVEVIELTTDELYATDLFHATALRIAHRLKKRIRSEDEGKFRERRAELRQQLLVDDALRTTDASETATYIRTNEKPSDNIWDGVSISDDWQDIMPDDINWIDDAGTSDEPWAAEAFDWDDDQLHVFGSRSDQS